MNYFYDITASLKFLKRKNIFEKFRNNQTNTEKKYVNDNKSSLNGDYISQFGGYFRRKLIKFFPIERIVLEIEEFVKQSFVRLHVTNGRAIIVLEKPRYSANLKKSETLFRLFYIIQSFMYISSF